MKGTTQDRTGRIGGMSRAAFRTGWRGLAVATLVVLLSVSFTPAAFGQEEEAAIPSEAAVARGYRWAVNDLMRLYEAIRVAGTLESRFRIWQRMRLVMEEWVAPLERATKFHHSGKIPVQCSPEASFEDYGCLARNMAIAHIYFGLAKGMVGFAGGGDAELACAERIFPNILDTQIYLRRPPEFKDELETDLMRAPEVRKLVEDAFKDERAKWPVSPRRIRYVVLPEPRPAEKEANWYVGPPLNLNEYPVIEPVSVEDVNGEFYAEAASEQLRRTLKKLYTFEGLDSDNPSVCPDPRVFFLPPGEYVFYSSAERDFPQGFSIKDAGNCFVLEHFSMRRLESEEGPPVYKAAWFRAPCIGGACGGKASNYGPRDK